MTYYLAVDIGASSGRHILAWIQDGQMQMEEIYRFPNGLISRNGHAVWDLEALYSHIVEGMRQAFARGKIPSFMGIDTWGVDYVLLDNNGQPIGDAVGYRDVRTNGMDKILATSISEKSLYERVGIQKQIFNTIYQLLAQKQEHPEELDTAEHLLMIPDYFNYRLTGVCQQEYTNATTTGLVSLKTSTWDLELLDCLGLPRNLFGPLAEPGTVVGHLLPEVAKVVGYDVQVLHTTSHDTASAVLAVPASGDNEAYLSSGTWSLLGVESIAPLVDEVAYGVNLTNEGGFEKRYRCLKNIMGLWMIQSIRKEANADGHRYSFEDLSQMAIQHDQTKKRINVNDLQFLAPNNMAETVREAINDSNATLGEVLAVVYHSLAECYAVTIAELQKVTGKRITTLHIIGGGCQDDYLNKLTAKAAGIPIYAGPVEATAIGNILSQMLGIGLYHSVKEARSLVYHSFGITRIDAEC